MARMVNGMRLKVALLALALPLAACKQQPSSELPGAVNAERIIAANPDEWLSYGRTYDEQRHSPLDQITQGNIKDLGLAWFADLDTSRGQEATPLAIDGKIYITTAWSKAKAYDAVTGKLEWEYDPKVPGERGVAACCDVVNRGFGWTARPARKCGAWSRLTSRSPIPSPARRG